MRRQFLLLALLRFSKLGLSLLFLLICARLFGVGVTMDSWVFASGLVAAAGMFAWGPVNEIVRSRFLLQAARSSFAEAAQSATRLMRFTALGSVLLALVLWLAGPWLLPLLYTGADAESDRLVLQVFVLMLPSLVLGQVLALGAAYLNCCDMIYAPECIGVGAALLSLGCVYALGPSLDVYALIVAHYAGLLFSVLGVLVLLLHRRFLGAELQPAFGPMVRDYLLFSVPLFFSYGAGQANGMLEKALASSLGAGMVSSVNYASQIKSTLQAVVSSVLFSLAVPRLTHAQATGCSLHEFSLVWREVQRVVVLFLLVVLPPFWGGADLITTVLFGASRVSVGQQSLVTDLIRWYLIALFPVALYLVHGSALLAQQKGRSYAVWGVASQAISACCCLLLVQMLGPKVFPVALLFSHGLAAVAMARAVGGSRLLWIDLLGWLALLALAGIALAKLGGWLSSHAVTALPALISLIVIHGLVLFAGYVGYRWWWGARA